MRKILAWVTVAITAILLGFTIVKLVGGLEVISVSASGDDVITLADKSIYTEVGETFSLDINQENKDDRTEISVEIKHEEGKEILSYNEETSIVTALNGGVARIIVTTTNKHFATLYLDVFVGDGSASSPYYIASATQLAAIGTGEGKYAHYNANDCYKLVNDIDVSETLNGYWLPLNAFSGRLDGNGYSIQNLKINRTEFMVNNGEVVADFTNVGLFAAIAQSGRVYNLKFDNFKASGVYGTIGTVAGVNYGVIDRIEVRSVEFDNVQADYVGGIVGINATTDNTQEGYNRNIARIDRCSVNLVYGKENGISGTIGGVVGLNAGGVVIYTYSVGDVTLADGSVFGGVIGSNSYEILNGTNEEFDSIYAPAKLKDSYSAVTVNTSKLSNINNEVIGGVIGINNDLVESENNTFVNRIVGCYYDAEILGNDLDGIGLDQISEAGVVSSIDREEKLFFVYGSNSNKMKVAENYLSHERLEKIYDNNGNLIDEDLVVIKWNFEKIWNIDASVNSGYPILRFERINDIDATDYNEYDDFSTIVEVKVDVYNLNLTQGIYGQNKLTTNLAKVSIYDENDELLASVVDSYDLAIFSDAKIYKENVHTLLIYRNNNLVYKIIAESLDESYSVVGWDNGDISELSWYATPIDCTKDISLTVWLNEVIKTTKVIFDYNNATTTGIQSKVVEYGKEYGTLPVPTRLGYTFEGWYLENTYTTRVDNNSIVATTAPTHYLYAKWVEVQSTPVVRYVTIALNANGGTVSVASVQREAGSVYGNLPSASRNGYTFLGWYSDINLSNRVVSTTTLVSNCNHTLYAGWKLIENTPVVPDLPVEPSIEYVTVYFNANGGSTSVSSKTVVYGEYYGNLPSATRSGYIFLGWYSSAALNSAVTSSTIVTRNYTHTLYAGWRAIQTTPETPVEEKTIVYFNANGGSGSMASQTFVNGVAEALNCNRFTRSGYTFLGWARTASATSALYGDGATLIIHESNGSVTLYAVWKKNTTPAPSTPVEEKTIVYFNANGGSGSMASQTFVNGVAESLNANAFTRSGYTFLGWARTASATSALYGDGATLIIHESNGSVTLYAVWKKNAVTETPSTPVEQEKTIVYFSANGGSGSMASQTFVNGVAESLNCNKFTRSGYTFLGWARSSGATSALYGDGATIIIRESSGAVTLYAVWKKNAATETPSTPVEQETTVVYFSANGGSGSMASQTFVNGVAESLNSNAFTRSGYTFLGWARSSGATTPLYGNGATIKINQSTGAVVLYAVWAKN